jgi:hypothetical protein
MLSPSFGLGNAAIFAGMPRRQIVRGRLDPVFSEARGWSDFNTTVTGGTDPATGKRVENGTRMAEELQKNAWETDFKDLEDKRKERGLENKLTVSAGIADTNPNAGTWGHVRRTETPGGDKVDRSETPQCRERAKGQGLQRQRGSLQYWPRVFSLNRPALIERTFLDRNRSIPV